MCRPLIQCVYFRTRCYPREMLSGNNVISHRAKKIHTVQRMRPPKLDQASDREIFGLIMVWSDFGTKIELLHCDMTEKRSISGFTALHKILNSEIEPPENGPNPNRTRPWLYIINQFYFTPEIGPNCNWTKISVSAAAVQWYKPYLKNFEFPWIAMGLYTIFLGYNILPSSIRHSGIMWNWYLWRLIYLKLHAANCICTWNYDIIWINLMPG